MQCLTKFCEFGLAFSEMLHDQLVCGIHDAQIQKEPKSTLDKPLKLTLAQESAE